MIPLSLKSPQIDFPTNSELFWDVKMKMEILEKINKQKNRNGHAFCNGIINGK